MPRDPLREHTDDQRTNQGRCHWANDLEDLLLLERKASTIQRPQIHTST
jgi:hypothetical protein